VITRQLEHLGVPVERPQPERPEPLDVPGVKRSRFCSVPGGMELDLSIPNEDPATSSMWLVEGRDVNVL
jgi:hypothetical protein